MGFINVETPDGFVDFEIAGDEPTKEELLAIQTTVLQSATPSDFPDLSERIIRAAPKEEIEQEAVEVPVPTNEGEVQDHGFQFFYGRADRDDERALRLEQTFGPGTYEQVGHDDFFLLLDKISPELKNQYNLPQEGTIRVNEKGFSVYDLSRLGGQEAGPLGLALGAGLMFSGVGIGPGMLLMAAAGAGGRGIDELIEKKYEGLQLQSDKEVYGDMAITGVLYGLGEGITRGIWGLGRRLIKGPGPRPDAARIEELMARGMGRKGAELMAREEAKTQLRRSVKGGARPTISEVSGKAITGRLQAIYEGIFPNRKAAELNRKYVDQLLKDYYGGAISQAEAKSGLQRQAEIISREINNRMKNADADEALRLADQHLKKVIDNEFDILLKMYKPGSLDVQFEQGINQAARMFEQDSAHYYSKVDDAFKALILPGSVAPTVVRRWSYQGREIKQGVPWKDATGKVHKADWVDTLNSAAKAELGIIPGQIIKRPGGVNVGTFNAAPMKNVIRNMESDKAQSAALGDTFRSGLLQYIRGKDSFTLNELTSLRAALRTKSKDPTLMPGITDKHFGDLIDSINNTITNRLEGLAYLRTPQGTAMAGMNPAGPVWDPALAAQFDDAIRIWQKANKVHASGIKRFKDGAAEALDKNIKERLFVGGKPVLETLIEPGNPAKLNYYLKLITPTGRSMEGLTAAKAPVFREAAALVDAGQVRAANKLLESAQISDELLPRLPAFIEDLAPDKFGKMDPYRKQVQGEFIRMMGKYANMAEARAKPIDVRNAFRDSLAREWLEQNSLASSRFGAFDPGKFAQSFDELGEGLQTSLFGKQNADAMRSLFKDYHMVGFGKTEFANATAQILRGDAAAIRQRAATAVGERPIADEIANLQGILKESIRQSDDKLFQAVRTGRLQNADDLVESVIANPNHYDRLVNEFGIPKLEAAGGFKDAVMARIVSTSFPEGITPDAIASGSWGNAMRRTIQNLNGKTDSHGTGSLSKILGQDTVDSLIQFSKLGERISDSSLRSKTGLAPAAFAAGAGFRLVTEPLHFMGEALAIFTMGRVLRQKWLLNSLLKPRYQAGVMGLKGGRRLYQQGLRAGADVDQASPLMMEIRERVAQEARLMTLSQLQPSADTRETISEEIIQPGMEFLKETSEEIGPAVQGLPAQVRSGLGIPPAQAAPPQALAQVAQAQAQETPEQRAIRVLAAREEAKLTGDPMIT